MESDSDSDDEMTERQQLKAIIAEFNIIKEHMKKLNEETKRREHLP